MTAIQQVIENLTKATAEMDAQSTKNHIQWGLDRKAAIREFMNSEEAKVLHRDAWAYYGKLHAIAGGKTWYSVFVENNEDGVKEFMAKNAAAIFEKRNATIAKKLTEAGVTAVEEMNFNMVKDGFHGTYVFSTNNGRKCATIKTIVAGGYNIQCLHNRTLVKVS